MKIQKKKKHKTRPRSSYHNVQSYDDEIELVIELLRYCKEYERYIEKAFKDAYQKLCDLYKREFPFYYKAGVDGKRFNELIMSLLYSSRGEFNTKFSELLDEIYRETRELEVRYLMGWLMLDYLLTVQTTSESLGLNPQSSVEFMINHPVIQLVEQPWCADNKTVMDRINEALSTMDSNLRLVIVQGIQRGWSQDRMAEILGNITGMAAWKARRLIRTETMAVWSKTTKEMYLANGIEYVEIIGDAECGGICLDYVGTAIPLREAVIGDDLPPYHPNCACSYCAYDETKEQDESRGMNDEQAHTHEPSKDWTELINELLSNFI